MSTITKGLPADWRITLTRPFGLVRGRGWYDGHAGFGPQLVMSSFFVTRRRAVAKVTEWIEAEEAEFDETGSSEGVSQR